MAKKKHRRQFVKVPVYRLAAGEDSAPLVNRRGQPLPDSDVDKWEYFKNIYVVVEATSSSEPVLNHQVNTITTFAVEITFTKGLTAKMRFQWRGMWLSFVGRPYVIGERCHLLKARAVECEPCDASGACCNG